jgi:tRNA (guanine-N7-)-methyltransferase
LSRAVCRFLIPWLELSWPLDWEAIFRRPGRLVVEIGFGDGRFVAEKARTNPGENFVGIERSWGSVTRLLRRIERDGLDNIRVLQGSASCLVEHLFKPDDIDEAYVNFSDPWPKERHHARRLIQPGFVRLLGSRLRPGGEATLSTDHAAYAAWIADVLEGQALLRSKFSAPFVHDLPGRRPTKYEQKARTAGSRIYYFVWRRDACLSLSPTSEDVGEMPNVILEGPIDPTRLFSEFEPQTWQESHRGVPVVSKLVGIYRDLREGHHLVEVMVKEGDLSQQFGVSVISRPDARVLIKLSAMGRPRPLYGVKRAVWRVAELVLRQFPEMKVASTTVAPDPVEPETEMEDERPMPF